MFLCSHKERGHGSFGISTSSLKWDQNESIYTNQKRRWLVQIGLKLVNGLNHNKHIHMLHHNLDLGGICHFASYNYILCTWWCELHQNGINFLNPQMGILILPSDESHNFVDHNSLIRTPIQRLSQDLSNNLKMAQFGQGLTPNMWLYTIPNFQSRNSLRTIGTHSFVVSSTCESEFESWDIFLTYFPCHASNMVFIFR